MSLLAKSIIKNRLWLVTDGHVKVGKIEADNDGYQLQLGGKQQYFSNTTAIEKMIKIEFERPVTKTKSIPFSNWPTNEKTFNDVIDVKRKIHLYTKTPTSKCFYAAGYFKILIDDQWVVQFCPKYIFLQRYEYMGPFMLEEETNIDK